MDRRPLSRPSVRRAVLMEAIEPRQHMDADNTIAGAVNLGSVATYVSKSGSINKSSDASDFYKFTVPSGNKDFKLKLSGLTNNADLYLYNSSKTQINSSKVSGTGSESITKTKLSAGTYYAEVRAVSSSSNYSLKLATDFTGDSKTAARDLGTLSGPKAVDEYVGSLDTGDYYKFKVAAGKTSLTLDTLSADANLELLDSNGNSVAKSSNPSTGGDYINKVLTAGTYYAKVVPASSSVDAKYHLSLVPPIAGFVDVNVGTLGSTTKTYTGKLDSSHTQYNYEFNVSGNGVFEANLTGLTDTAELRLYSADGKFYAANIRPGTEHITFGVVSGNYSLQVWGDYTTNTNFSLTMVKNPVPADTGGDHNSPKAFALDSSGNATVTGAILNRYNYEDAYSFSSSDPGPIYGYVYGLTASADVFLVNANTGQTVAEADYNFNAGTATLAYEPTGPGSWYVLIKQGTASDKTIGPATHYTLQIHTPLDRGGNTMATAPVVSTPYSVSNRVGKFDNSDFYKVYVGDASYVTMDLTTSDNPAALVFYGPDGTSAGSDVAQTGSPGHLSFFLHTGGYCWVQVANAVKSSFSNYSLTIKTQAF